ncbi:MAG TPA: hypothetical protein VHO49_15370 [Anaerolineales bacterium]|nr:hypothetical protein [Anaerolineales bacterium]
MRKKLFLTVISVIVIVASLSLTAQTASADTVCNSDFVSQDGQVILILPSGADDTDNIQCAFDLAVATGPGKQVTLAKGIFHTSQIVVYNFHGTFSGAGAEKTRIYNVQDMYVTPVDYYLEPPSATNPWPSLFSFFDGAYQIHDLSIFVTGTGTTPWTIWGIDPPMTGLMFGIGVFGTHADVVVRDITMDGELQDSPTAPLNLGNGVYMWGWNGDSNLPISGSLFIERSTFKTMHYGTPVANLLDVSATITQNTYVNTMFAMDGYDLEESSLVFTKNQVTFEENNGMPHFGAVFYNSILPEITGSHFLFANNQFEGEVGIDFEPVLGAGNSCLFLGNNTQAVSDYPLILGEGTHDCQVIGGSLRASVLDLGTDNILIGVNNMGTGVGPAIQHLLRIK